MKSSKGNSNYEIIYSEARDLLNEQITSFRKVTDKSYFLITFIFSIQAFAVTKILSSENEIFYLFVIILFLIPAIIIYPNLLPRKMSLPGAEPNQMLELLKYSDTVTNKSEDEFIKYRIEDLQVDIDNNKIEIEQSNNRLKNAVIASFLCLLAGALFWFWIRCLLR